MTDDATPSSAATDLRAFADDEHGIAFCYLSHQIGGYGDARSLELTRALSRCVEGVHEGDVLVIESHHRRVADGLARELIPAIRARGRRCAVTVAGESGCGKSETAAALSQQLAGSGIPSIVLGQDDYFALPPRSNDARRRTDPEWLGPHVEVRLDLLQANVDAALAGADSIEKPVVDYDANTVSTEQVSLAGITAVLVEGTYVSLLRHVDCRIFIDRNRLETLGTEGSGTGAGRRSTRSWRACSPSNTRSSPAIASWRTSW